MAAKNPASSVSAKRNSPVVVRPGRSGAAPKGASAPAEIRKAKVKTKAAPAPRRPVPAILIKAGLIMFMLGALLLSYKVTIASSFFAIKRFEIVGNQHASEDEIIRAVRPVIRDQSLLETDLAAVRKEVERKALIKEAIVMRILPDTLRLIVKERQPVALVRRESGAYVWLSADAVELGDLEQFRPARIPPLLVGLTENDNSDRAQRDNRDRIALYQKILRDLAEDATAVEEINLNLINPPIVKFQLKDSRIIVEVGRTEYAPRLRTALDVIDAARRGDSARLEELRVPKASFLIENASRMKYVHSLDRIMINFAPVKPPAAQPQIGQSTKANVVAKKAE